MDPKLVERCVNCSLNFEGINVHQKSIKFKRYVDNPISKTLSTVDIKVLDAVSYIFRMTTEHFVSSFIGPRQDVAAGSHHELPNLAVCLRCKLLLSKMYNCLLEFNNLTDEDSVLKIVADSMYNQDDRCTEEKRGHVRGCDVEENSSEKHVSVCFEQIFETGNIKVEVSSDCNQNFAPEIITVESINTITDSVTEEVQVYPGSQCLPSAEQIGTFITDANLNAFDEVELENLPVPLLLPLLTSKIVCLQCAKKFTSSARYLKHDHSNKIAHKVNVEKWTYQCQDCQLSFEYYQNFRLHTITVHLREPIVVCDVCNKYFGCLETLKKHKSAKHSTWMETEDSITGEADEPSLIILETRSVCEEKCVYDVIDNVKKEVEYDTLKLINSMSGSLPKKKSKGKMYRYFPKLKKPYECKVCGKYMHSEDSIKIHLRISHK